MHTNDEEKYDLLINTNPVAYNELIDFVPEYGQKAYKKETLPSDTDIYFGEWKCPSGKHTWISTIKYRSNEENDPGCPICKNNNLGLNPKLLAFRNHFSTFRTWIESLWYCDKCYAFYWAKEVRDTHTFERHNLSQCRPGQQTLKEEFPNIAEEWSDKNLIPADKICYNFNNDYKFIWNCRKCGMEYKSSMKNNVYFSRKENACPYCAGEIPFPNESLAAQYPQIAKQWHYNLNNNRILNLDDDEEITPEKTFPDNRSWGYFTCPNCGVIREMDVGDLIAEKECPYCTAGMTKEYSSVLYKELEYTGITYINPEQKQAVTFRCHIYGHNYNAKPIDIFYMKKMCPYCSGKEAVPGKTSFKALYPKIECELLTKE